MANIDKSFQDNQIQNKNLENQEKIENEKIIKESGNWEARKPFKFGKDYFELQFEFAKELQQRLGGLLLDVIKNFAPILRFNSFQYEGDSVKGVNHGVTEDNIVDMAYAKYLKTYNDELVEYHPEEGSRFGCFYYDKDDDREVINIHFLNTEFDNVGPLDKAKVELRKKEMWDMLNDIKIKYPDIEEIQSVSWLYNLPSFKRLFPQSFLDNMKIDERDVLWGKGTTIWGQFFNNKYELKEDLTNELLQQLKELSVDKKLSEVFKNTSLLMPPLAIHGPIEDFYKMYLIE